MLTTRYPFWLAGVMAFFVSLNLTLQHTKADGPEKWFYAFIDLAGDPDSGGTDVNYGLNQFISEILPLLEENNYSAIILSNYYLGHEEKLTDDDSNLVKNLKTLVEKCGERDIEIIPEIMNVGGSSPILINDPNLAEGTPVKKMEFVVKKNEYGERYAEVKNRCNHIPHGNLNADWTVVKDALGAYYKNVDVTTAGTIGTGGEMDRHVIVQKRSNEENDGEFFLKVLGIQLKPLHQYELSFQVKTDDLVLGGDWSFYAMVQARFNTTYRRLERNGYQPEKNQQWKTYVVNFNSLGSSDDEFVQAEFVLGIEEIIEGSIRIDNLVLREVGGVNLLRRDDLPVTIHRADNSCEPLDPADVAAWLDPDLEFNEGAFYHDESPAVLRIVHDQKFKEGDTLEVSYYHAAIPTSIPYVVCCSLVHSDVDALIAMQIRELNRIMDDRKPTRWIVNHDEIRAAGHEPKPDDVDEKDWTPGNLLAWHLERSIDIAKRESPGSHLILISDMYDPFHNAPAQKNDGQSFHPMVNGTFTDSWKSIPKDGSMSVWNWNLGETGSDMMIDGLGKQRASFGFFDELDLVQTVGGFYDVVEGDDEKDQRCYVRDRTLQHFRVAYRNAYVNAVCYYTAKRDARFLDVFAEAADTVWSD